MLRKKTILEKIDLGEKNLKTKNESEYNLNTKISTCQVSIQLEGLKT